MGHVAMWKIRSGKSSGMNWYHVGQGEFEMIVPEVDIRRANLENVWFKA